jgi:hypothetical protein
LTNSFQLNFGFLFLYYYPKCEEFTLSPLNYSNKDSDHNSSNKFVCVEFVLYVRIQTVLS